MNFARVYIVYSVVLLSLREVSTTPERIYYQLYDRAVIFSIDFNLSFSSFMRLLDHVV
jgi:hypothetical protein